MRVLVAFGSKRGGTAGLAEMIGTALVESGHVATVASAPEVSDLTGLDAVIVAGALYANRWHRHARRFVRRHRGRLSELPVWLVSSGPLDDSAEGEVIPPTKQVRKLMTTIRARGHVTFGGRLEADAKGFPASAMAKTKAGDWRYRDHVLRWVHGVVDELRRRARAVESTDHYPTSRATDGGAGCVDEDLGDPYTVRTGTTPVHAPALGADGPVRAFATHDPSTIGTSSSSVAAMSFAECGGHSATRPGISASVKRSSSSGACLRGTTRHTPRTTADR